MTDMASPKDGQPAPAVVSKEQSSSPLQWFRELVAGAISLAILTVAVIMLYGTYTYAKITPTDDNAALTAARKEAYDRQKDIMLYALALLGTVTGYYLGRVPAELHAQQAQRSAQTAQEQLQQTQTKLTDTAGSAATAATQVAVVEAQKTAAQAKLSKAVGVLDRTREAIATASPAAAGRRTLGGESEEARDVDQERLQNVVQEIDLALKELRVTS